MNTKPASTILKILAVIAVGVGLFVIGVAGAILHSEKLANAIFPTPPLAVFGGYIVYLGYLLFSRLSRSAFERLYFGVVIALIVIVSHATHVSGYPGLLIPICLGVIGLLARPFFTNGLFPHHREE
jgi:hypothetical protein